MRTLLRSLAMIVFLAFAPAASAVLPSGNILQNPGGEAGQGANDAVAAPSLPNWSTTPSFTAVRYGAPDFPTPEISAAYGGGLNFFAGGPNSAFSSALQDVDVSAAAPEIQAGNVHAVFSAHLGGFSSQSDNAVASIQFLDASGNAVRGTSIGPVTPAEREGQSILLPRSAIVPVHPSTRTVRVVLQATRQEGSYNDGYSDNVVVELARGAAPVFAKSIDVARVSGTVLIKPPGAKKFVALSSLRTIPVGAIIDARRGRVRLTTSDGAGRFQSSEFYEGVFKVIQRARDNGIVELALFGGSFRRCPRARRSASGAAKPRSVRHLWGSGSGKFRTKGRFGSATLRGTTWLTDDRCDGTLVRVTQGSVNVRDIPRKRTVTVRAPNRYLARARR